MLGKSPIKLRERPEMTLLLTGMLSINLKQTKKINNFAVYLIHWVFLVIVVCISSGTSASPLMLLCCSWYITVFCILFYFLLSGSHNVLFLKL